MSRDTPVSPTGRDISETLSTVTPTVSLVPIPSPSTSAVRPMLPPLCGPHQSRHRQTAKIVVSGLTLPKNWYQRLASVKNPTSTHTFPSYEELLPRIPQGERRRRAEALCPSSVSYPRKTPTEAPRPKTPHPNACDINKATHCPLNHSHQHGLYPTVVPNFKFAGPKGVCWICKRAGHKAGKCPLKGKDNAPRVCLTCGREGLTIGRCPQCAPYRKPLE